MPLIAPPRGSSPLSKILPGSFTPMLSLKNRKAAKKRLRRKILHQTKSSQLIPLFRPATCTPAWRFLEVAHAPADAPSPPPSVFRPDRSLVFGRGRDAYVRRCACSSL